MTSITKNIYNNPNTSRRFRRGFETLPESVFYGQWGIRRQRVAEALLKLEAAGLVVLQKEKGKKTRVKLATPRGQLNGK
jgi:DNA-binding GntR family transcriptional regulator